MFGKIYKENQQEVEKCTTSIVCVSCEIWFTAKINKVKLFCYQPSKEVIVIEPNPLSSSFYDTTLGLFVLDGYVLLI